jgi:hypothetical protein
LNLPLNIAFLYSVSMLGRSDFGALYISMALLHSKHSIALALADVLLRNVLLRKSSSPAQCTMDWVKREASILADVQVSSPSVLTSQQLRIWRELKDAKQPAPGMRGATAVHSLPQMVPGKASQVRSPARG